MVIFNSYFDITRGYHLGKNVYHLSHHRILRWWDSPGKIFAGARPGQLLCCWRDLNLGWQCQSSSNLRYIPNITIRSPFFRRYIIYLISPCFSTNSPTTKKSSSNLRYPANKKNLSWLVDNPIDTKRLYWISSYPSKIDLGFLVKQHFNGPSLMVHKKQHILLVIWLF